MPIRGIPGSILPSRIRLLNEYPIELSFAMTVEKSQGQTMECAIIALSGRRAQKCQFDYASVYVAFSRVRHKNNIRLLLKQGNGRDKKDALMYLRLLQPNKATFAFFEGFKNQKAPWNSQTWNKNIAFDAYLSK